jgi:TonB family protein
MNMRFPLLTFLWLCSVSVYSQKVTVFHFNKEGLLTDDIATSAYYDVDSTWDDESNSSHSFYRSGKRRSEQKRRPMGTPGYTTTYYESGGIETKGLKKNSIPVGTVSVFYENGKPMGDVEFPMEPAKRDDHQFTIHQYWDSLGNKIIDDGNGNGFISFKPFKDEITPGTGQVLSGRKHGTWKGTLSDHGVYEERYDNGKLIAGYQQRNGKTYNYTALSVLPEHVGGLSGLANLISREIKYPREARKGRVEGRVFVEFIVDEKGHVANPRVIKGISRECDAESMRVAALTKWTPGLERGVPVKSRFVLPIVFKL